MDEWKHTSGLAMYAETRVLPQRNAFLGPSIGPGMAPVLPDDDTSLQEAIHTLRGLVASFRNDDALWRHMNQLIQVAEDISTSPATMREEQLFEQLKAFRTRLLWAPIALAQVAPASNLTLLAIAHLYGVALAIDASIPELSGAAFGALTVEPIADIERKLQFSTPGSHSPFDSTPDAFMRFPREMASRVRISRSPFEAVVDHNAEAPLPGQQSPFGFQNLHLDSAPSTPPFPPSYSLYLNPSFEDLSVPPSPFLQDHASPGSRPHSGIYQQSSRPNSISFDRWSSSPAHSPAFSPAAPYLEDPGYGYGESSTPSYDYPGGFVSPAHGSSIAT
jgi:hypothetical protein